MRQTLRWMGTLAALSCPFSKAMASDANGIYTIYGIGGLPCHAFLTAVGREREYYEFWLAGFLTASNANYSVTSDITPEGGSQKFFSIVWKQCRAYHDITLSEAALTIANRLHDRLISNKNPYEGYE